MQHTKEQLVTNPQLYEIGLKNQCFSTLRFFENIFSGIVNGLFLFLFCFYGEDGTVNTSEAKNGWFWVDGTMVYGAVVMIVNIKMAHKTNTHTWISTAIIVGSVVLFWGWLAVESGSPAFPDVYCIFGQMFSKPDTYWILILCCWFNFAQFLAFSNFFELHNQYEVKQKLVKNERDSEKMNELARGSQSQARVRGSSAEMQVLPDS